MAIDLASLGAFGTAPAGSLLPETFETACESLLALKEAPPFTGPDGDRQRVIEVCLNREEQCLAWVEWCWNSTRRIERHEYHLCARTPDGQRLSWEIESYNPYFGVFPEELTYTAGIVTLRYRDKHSTYRVQLDEFNLAQRRTITATA